MRDQEEELLLTEAQRSHGLNQRPKRSYWVEEEGQWGLLTETTDFEDAHDQDIFWVGEQLPPEVYAASSSPTSLLEEEYSWVTQLPNGSEMEWHWQDDDFYAKDSDGCFWSWSETKTWLDYEECLAASPADAKQFEEIYANFQDRIRSFKDS